MTKLTEEMVIARSRQSDLSSIKKLNCWGSELSDVSIIRRMRGVEVLALSVNRISNLSDFEDCHKLQELYLRKNNIQDINDLTYLQGLKHLKNLWLEENPCVEKAGPNYRSIVLRALPNLKKLDNVDVNDEELAEALSGASLRQEEDVYEDAYSANSHHSASAANQQQQQQYQQQQYQQQQQQQYQQQQAQQKPASNQQQYRNNSPVKERTPPNQEYSPAEPTRPPSPKYNNNNHRHSYHQPSYDRSPGSDHDSQLVNIKDRAPIVPSISSQSMKEYYQSDRPTPTHYRHSQTDLTEWDESPQNEHNRQVPHHRRSGPSEREPHNFQYRNGSREKEDWEEVERGRREPRRPDRFNDNASVVSNAVLSHYANFHRRPVNRSSNLLSATLCLVKELDYPSLEVVEHAVRCRIDELATD
ncbi:TPR-containing protein DDB_G0280363 isoform X2 [Bradysia coprophila]|uniref:TPR-containing protein DDB_G0280363 isoform X2 n=1 Tax=Bradysia coprophila TaxID=38358 RepID=UPI00187DCF50|nr:TPR-containing protein DDB_G0280363 isoform X2 [Bradysia coprophila]